MKKRWLWLAAMLSAGCGGGFDSQIRLSVVMDGGNNLTVLRTDGNTTKLFQYSLSPFRLVRQYDCPIQAYRGFFVNDNLIFVDASKNTPKGRYAGQPYFVRMDAGEAIAARPADESNFSSFIRTKKGFLGIIDTNYLGALSATPWGSPSSLALVSWNDGKPSVRAVECPALSPILYDAATQGDVVPLRISNNSGLNSLELFDLESGGAKTVGVFKDFSHPSVSADGSRVVVLLDRFDHPSIVVLDSNTGEIISKWMVNGSNIIQLGYAEEGNSYFTASRDQNSKLIVYKMAQGGPQTVGEISLP